MHDSPGSVVTQLCSGLQLYSAERRIADCILADVKWASVATSAELAKASHSSEATVTRLCHKLGYANYRKFQLELARDVLEQQETEARKRPPNDPLHQALLDLQNNRQEEVQATIQALNLVQLRKVLPFCGRQRSLRSKPTAAVCPLPWMLRSSWAVWASAA